MKKTQATLRREASTGLAVLYTAFELSNEKWKLAFSNGDKVRHVSVVARGLSQLEREIVAQPLSPSRPTPPSPGARPTLVPRHPAGCGPDHGQSPMAARHRYPSTASPPA